MSAFDLTEDQQDCLQELINVAMGQASDQLARYLDTFVYLKVPNIEQVKSDQLLDTLNQDLKATAVVSQGFFGFEGIRGEALLMYEAQDSHRLADLLGYEADELSFDEQIIDLSSILTTTFLNVFASQIDNQMSYSAPRLLSTGLSALTQYLQQQSFNWDLALKVRISYQVTDYSFNCEMVLLIPEEAIMNIKTVIDRILEEF
ncbi:chemotaxis protein [Colwellia sp. Arc7-635]|jgi:chemotaxis protein CheC|uniref:chemotaxis protein n=1 Tax=Colwellia sp. Arc7-635 TaxID=2497879 RepID=UPI000F851A66|nr:chemotaxis protein [Colwellia sp. Arc7-635]AZQ83298.1 chemotaxis protein [Colwellia sp. Arc7-635]